MKERNIKRMCVCVCVCVYIECVHIYKECVYMYIKLNLTLLYSRN